MQFDTVTTRRWRHPARAAASLVLGVALALSVVACTGPQPTPTPTVRVVTSSPSSALTVVARADASAAAIAVSKALYRTSPVVIVVPADDPAAQVIGASGAVSLGVPLLIGPPASGAAAKSAATSSPDAATKGNASAVTSALTSALSGELKRLNARSVVAVGSVALAPGTKSGRTITHVPASAKAVAAALRVRGTTKQIADGESPLKAVAGLPPGGGMLAPASTPEAGSATPSPDQPVVPRVNRSAPVAGTVAVALDSPIQLAAVATARAAGVPVTVLPADTQNLLASPAAMSALSSAKPKSVLALGAGFGADPSLGWQVDVASSGAQLPGGGGIWFPGHTLVAIYGTPGSPVLGVLGEQDLAASITRAQQTAAPYAALTSTTVVPMFEIIATVAAGSAGSDGDYSNEVPISTIQPWVEAAAKAGIYVVLDLQPGRTDFLTQAKAYQSLLELPNVGLALDPEWRLAPGQVPLEQIGSVGIAEVNGVVSWLADLTRDHALPQKILVLHQFQLKMIQDRAALDTSRPELAIVIHADGQGGQPDKQATWAALHTDAPSGIWWGWKNFYDEDKPMLTPQQTMSEVMPPPNLISYQ